MMGFQSAPERLFYDFCLEDHVPDDHLLRRIDQFLDLGDVRQELKPFYSHIGRPSVDPELMIRMLIVGYCFAIRSERRLCDEVHLTVYCGENHETGKTRMSLKPIPELENKIGTLPPIHCRPKFGRCWGLSGYERYKNSHCGMHQISWVSMMTFLA